MECSTSVRQRWSELCPLEDQDPRNDDAPLAEAVVDANVPWT